MLYKVKQQYARGTAKTVVAEFNDANDATLFIQAKLLDDLNRLKVRVIYQLLEGDDLVKEFTEAQVDNTNKPTMSSSTSGGSAAGSGQRSSFQPTPFNPSPRPSGIPHSWIKDEPDDKDKK